MSIAEILQQLPKLKTEERDLILRYIVVMERGEEDFPTTPAMLAAIDEGLHSANTEPCYSVEEIRHKIEQCVRRPE
jgi:hypothetical protein